mmetsp:Transcript_27056/g.51524  ORF Transcript_27056/g.51524 Transcript_27056/m.51524 type:complete len:230 (-) Transcript_27056:944-1633(-)
MAASLGRPRRWALEATCAKLIPRQVWSLSSSMGNSSLSESLVLAAILAAAQCRSTRSTLRPSRSETRAASRCLCVATRRTTKVRAVSASYCAMLRGMPLSAARTALSTRSVLHISASMFGGKLPRKVRPYAAARSSERCRAMSNSCPAASIHSSTATLRLDPIKRRFSSARADWASNSSRASYSSAPGEKLPMPKMLTRQSGTRCRNSCFARVMMRTPSHSGARIAGSS